jgi:hypothetical protein
MACDRVEGIGVGTATPAYFDAGLGYVGGASPGGGDS